jgi:hypothetical protein
VPASGSSADWTGIGRRAVRAYALVMSESPEEAVDVFVKSDR